MFTGIVETTATVENRSSDGLILTPSRRLKGLAVGESVAVDGVCLTVDRIRGPQVTFRLLAETVRVTTLGERRPGDRVNLERALQVGGRVGGHLLLGHVDGRGRVASLTRRGKMLTMELALPRALRPYLIPKGPIGVDGVSLTLDPRLEEERVRIHLVPHTCRATTLAAKAAGSQVNIEVDPVAKYLRGML